MRVSITDAQFRRWHSQGKTADEICRACGMTRTVYEARVADVFGLPGPTDPTPEQIEERCAEIQASWTDEERRRRIVGECMRNSRRGPLAHRLRQRERESRQAG